MSYWSSESNTLQSHPHPPILHPILVDQNSRLTAHIERYPVSQNMDKKPSFHCSTCLSELPLPAFPKESLSFLSFVPPCHPLSHAIPRHNRQTCQRHIRHLLLLMPMRILLIPEVNLLERILLLERGSRSGDVERWRRDVNISMAAAAVTVREMCSVLIGGSGGRHNIWDRGIYGGGGGVEEELLFELGVADLDVNWCLFERGGKERGKGVVALHTTLERRRSY